MRRAKPKRIGLMLFGALIAAVGLGGYLKFFRGREVTGVEARALVAAGARLVDVRTADEFARDHLPGAVNVPVQELFQMEW